MNSWMDMGLEICKSYLIVTTFCGTFLWWNVIFCIFYSLIHRATGAFIDVSGRVMQSNKPAAFFGVLVAVLCVLGFSGNAFIREGRTLDTIAFPKEKVLPRRSSNYINHDRIRYPAHISKGKYEKNLKRFRPGFHWPSSWSC